MLKNIYEVLFSALTSRNVSKNRQRKAFYEMLTHTEKIMLGKRVVAVSMFERGASAYRAGRALKLSPTTVVQLRRKWENGELENLAYVCRDLQKGPLINYIENLLKPLPKYGTGPAQLFKEK